jgi:hypothetical protein
MVELFPDGFEEVEHADGVELAAYTDPAGEEQLWHAFGRAGGRTDGVASTSRYASVRSGSDRLGLSRTRTRRRS